MTDLIGKCLGDFEIVREVGRGGMDALEGTTVTADAQSSRLGGISGKAL